MADSRWEENGRLFATLAFNFVLPLPLPLNICQDRLGTSIGKTHQKTRVLAVRGVALAYVATGPGRDGSLPPLEGWAETEGGIGKAPAPTLVAGPTVYQ